MKKIFFLLVACCWISSIVQGQTYCAKGYWPKIYYYEGKPTYPALWILDQDEVTEKHFGVTLFGSNHYYIENILNTAKNIVGIDAQNYYFLAKDLQSSSPQIPRTDISIVLIDQPGTSQGSITISNLLDRKYGVKIGLGLGLSDFVDFLGYHDTRFVMEPSIRHYDCRYFNYASTSIQSASFKQLRVGVFLTNGGNSQRIGYVDIPEYAIFQTNVKTSAVYPIITDNLTGQKDGTISFSIERIECVEYPSAAILDGKTNLPIDGNVTVNNDYTSLVPAICQLLDNNKAVLSTSYLELAPIDWLACNAKYFKIVYNRPLLTNEQVKATLTYNTVSHGSGEVVLFSGNISESSNFAFADNYALITLPTNWGAIAEAADYQNTTPKSNTVKLTVETIERTASRTDRVLISADIFKSPNTMPKPVISSDSRLCYDGVNDKHLLTLQNHNSFLAFDRTYTLHYLGSGNTESLDVTTGTHKFAPIKDEANETTVYLSVKNKTTNCVVSSDTVAVQFAKSPQLPTLQGSMNYCSSENSTYLVHSNPEYHTQYWLYDVTGGNEKFLRHKGANFWIFRPDQHDPKEEAPTEINGEAYYDMRLSAGKYEIRATHDKNSCVTVAPFEIVSFSDAAYQMQAKSTVLRICNSDVDGVNVLDLFVDGDLKSAIISNPQNYTLVWTAKKDYDVIGATAHDPKKMAVENAKSGTYAVTLAVTNASGCTNSYSSSIVVTARPAAFTVAAAKERACDTSAVTIAASNGNVADVARWEWYNDGSKVGDNSSSSANMSLAAAGAHKIHAVAYNETGCYTASPKIEVPRIEFNPDIHFITYVVHERCQSASEFSLFDLLTGEDKNKVLEKKDNVNYQITHTPFGLSIDNDLGKYMVNPAQCAAKSYELALKVSSNGCDIYKAVSFTIKPTPASFTLSASSSLLCDSAKVTITPSCAGTSGLTYEWYVNEAKRDDITGATPSFALPDGQNTIYAVVSNASGCTATSPTISVEAWAVKTNVKMSTEAISVCEVKNGEIDLYGYLTGSVADREALKDENNAKGLKFLYEGMTVGYNSTAYHLASFASNPAKSDGSPYRLRFTIWQESHATCKRTYERNVKVLPRPVDFTLSASNAQACNDDDVSISAGNGVAGLTYEWTVNGQKVGGQSVSILPKVALAQDLSSITPVVSNVSAITKNAEGCVTASSNVATTKIHSLSPAIAWSSTGIDICQNASPFNLQDYLVGADKSAVLQQQQGMTYSISSTTGLALDANNNVTPSSSAVGTYTVAITVHRADCRVSFDMKVNVNPTPAQFTIATSWPSQVLNGETTHLLCNSSSFDMNTSALTNTAQVKWYGDGAEVGTTSNGSYTYIINTDGTNNMSAVATSKKGCSTSSTNLLRVDRRTVDFSGIAVNTSPTAYCNGDENVNFFTFVTATNKSDIEGSSNGWGYALDAGGISQCAGENNPKMLCLQNSAPGTYNTLFTVTKNSCQSSWNKAITIKPVPGATTLTPEVSNLCENGSTTLTATTQNYVNTYTYNWYRDGELVRSGYTARTHSYTAESGVTQTTWKVAAVDNSCTGAMSNEVTVNNNQPSLDAAFTANTFSKEGFMFKIANTTKVERGSIKVYSVNKNTNATLERTPKAITNDVYTIELQGIGSADYEIYVTFSDDATGACTNSYTIGTINYSSASGYTVKTPTLPVNSLAITAATTVATADYDGEAERLYREYVGDLHKDEHKAFLAPTYTGSGEGVKLLIYSAQPENVTVSVASLTGAVISRRSMPLYGGITELWLEPHEKPQVPGMYYVLVEYANGNRETLKGVIK
ncbi:MAG: hypothetical protein LBK47_08000 [Prevotellaceae bacterium]|jgi:hypothetical protein|nr:hypothetical protein [Prevotellaceae bacterium]